MVRSLNVWQGNSTTCSIWKSLFICVQGQDHILLDETCLFQTCLWSKNMVYLLLHALKWKFAMAKIIHKIISTRTSILSFIQNNYLAWMALWQNKTTFPPASVCFQSDEKKTPNYVYWNRKIYHCFLLNLFSSKRHFLTSLRDLGRVDKKLFFIAAFPIFI